ncbi:MAG: hypothetical protein V3W22_03285 [Thermoplasmata archaeon]
MERIKEAALQAFEGGVSSIILKGSALTEDFIPGFSDLDVHVYVSSRYMRSERVPQLEQAIRFQRGIGDLRPERHGVSSFQIYFIDASKYPEDWSRPLPGTYRVVYGGSIDDSASTEEHMERAHENLREYEGYIDSLIGRFVDKPDSALSGMVRLVGIFLKGAILSAATVAHRDPEISKRMSLQDLIASLGEKGLDLTTATRFFSEVREWDSHLDNPERCRETFGVGIEALDVIKEWYSSLTD